MEPIIQVKNLTKDYGQGRGIFDFSFEIEKGKVYGLVGTNGSGKTTTLRHLMGFLKPTAGSCSIMGLDCWNDAKEIKNHVGYVPGDINFPDVGNGDNFLKIQAQYLGLQDFSRVNQLINLFKLDTTAPLKRMSKGMKQKTALIACFMKDADIYLLDEPSTGLDPLMRDTLIDVILAEKAKGKTIFMSSHIFKELEDTCDAIIFIDRGKIIHRVDKSQHTADIAKQYKVGFSNLDEFHQFLKKSQFKIVKIQEQYQNCNLLCETTKINQLFQELNQYKIKYFRNIPLTLEWYYTNIVNKEKEGGKL